MGTYPTIKRRRLFVFSDTNSASEFRALEADGWNPVFPVFSLGDCSAVFIERDEVEPLALALN
jgi:hypothetical protein